MTQTVAAEADLLQDRLELLRLRTLLVGALGMLALVVGLVALAGYGSDAVKLAGQMLVSNTGGFHVPSNLFQAQADDAWARTPVLLQIAFVVISISGMAQMTRQALGTVQVRLWIAVLVGLAGCIIYMQSDVGSTWNTSQRALVKAVRAKEWASVEQLAATSKNTVVQRYVMAQVGLAKPDTGLLQLHGKVLIDQIDNMLMRRGQDRDARDNGLLGLADAFNPEILRDIDIQVYGAPHTQIGLSLATSASSAGRSASQGGWALAASLLWMGVALAGMGVATALLLLWKRMASRLRWLRWFVAAG